MAEHSVIKALGRETKALIVVSEFEARRMPMFQLRAVLNELVSDQEEKKAIVDLVENDLKATGYHPNQIQAFLEDLLNESAPAHDTGVRVTRRLRSPFSMGFEDAPQSAGPLPPSAPVVASAVTPALPPKTPVPGLAPAGAKPVTGPAKVPGLGPVGQGQRVSAAAPPADITKPKVPVTQPVGFQGEQVKSSTFSNTGMFFGSGVTGVHVQEKPVVLVADDDKRIRIVFKLCLERLGYRVSEAEDGNQAWLQIQKGGLKLAVLDMKMPGLHGLEVLTRMSNQQLNLPVIICSAYDQLKDEFVVATYPKLRYLVKPVASEALEKAVKDLVGEVKQD